MSEYLSAFDGVNIPIKAGDQEVSTDDTFDTFVRVAGNIPYRSAGTGQAPAIPQEISCRGIVTGADMHVIQDLIDPIKAKRGISGTLTKTMGDSTTRTRTAELMQVIERRRARDRFAQEVTLSFRGVSAGWKGTAHNDQTTLNASPKTITVANGGNRRVTDAVLTIVAPGGVTTPVTSIIVAVAGISKFTYTGYSMVAGQTLVIDCGALTVTNTGGNHFQYFTLHATDHKIDDWLRLEPGNNSVVVTLVGGDNICTITFAYNDGWE